MKRNREEDPTINLTPMIDVVFLLLIFFLAGSSFHQADSQIPLEVPGVGALAPVARTADPRIVTVDRTRVVRLDGRPTTLSELSQTLGQATRMFPELAVVVRADGGGAVQGVTEVLKTVRSAGVRNIQWDVLTR